MEETLNETVKLIKSEDFDYNLEGKKVELFTLINQNGILAQFTNYGARLVSLWVQDKHDIFRDVVLGFSSLNEYIQAKEQYHGATIGRFANRISKGKFKLDGIEYFLACNNGENHLHGGLNGFHNAVWDAKILGESAIEFSHLSADGDEGYPGNLLVTVLYKLTENNELSIKYTATSDQRTIISLTNHAYFNLEGEGEENLDNHSLLINADYFTPLKHGVIPNGQIQSVEGTALDFRNLTSISSRINAEEEQLQIASGYDHNYVLGSFNKSAYDAKVKNSKSGIVLEVITDQPGMQFYTANYLDGIDTGKSGTKYKRRSAFCLETQAFPDSPNQTAFPSPILNAGEQYESTTVYRFYNLGVGGLSLENH